MVTAFEAWGRINPLKFVFKGLSVVIRYITAISHLRFIYRPAGLCPKGSLGSEAVVEPFIEVRQRAKVILVFGK
ncbi:hypothetical protein D3C75_1195270 [compost metagenome]